MSALRFPTLQQEPRLPSPLLLNQFAVPPVRAVVAIPARDEAERLAACLVALAKQRRTATPSAQPFGVLLLLNNCSDQSAVLGARLRATLPYPLQISTVTLPGHLSNAGYARRLAMDAAAAWLSASTSEDGLFDECFLLTTDADSRVAPDWIDRHFRLFRAGVDAVAGLVRDDPTELRRLPAQLRQRGRLEERYADLLTELESVLNPLPWDPWPRHSMASGASIGLRLSWYYRIGGLPLLSTGEDRALLDCLAASGAQIRHCRKTVVTTSCRLVGRAHGGMAETMRERIETPDSPCDETLPPLWLAINRFLLKAAERGGESLLPPGVFRQFSVGSQRLRPADLPREIWRAEQVLLSLRVDPSNAMLETTAASTRHRADIRAHATSVPLPERASVAESGGRELRHR